MTMDFKIPTALVVEHEQLHGELLKLTSAPGKIGAAARRVGEVLHMHVVKEEEYAMAPLGLLATLAEGIVTPDMAAILPMTDHLKAELPAMLAEHGEIAGALRKLTAAAKKEKKPASARFADALRLHLEMEEQVLYPAALLVGEVVRTRLGRPG
jgi:hypothetical protein